MMITNIAIATEEERQQELLHQRATERVRAGMAVLDQVSPGWASNLYLPTLDLSDRYCCILGQLFNEYTVGMRVLAHRGAIPSNVRGTQFGFDSGDDLSYSLLQSVWLEELYARLYPPDVKITTTEVRELVRV